MTFKQSLEGVAEGVVPRAHVLYVLVLFIFTKSTVFCFSRFSLFSLLQCRPRSVYIRGQPLHAQVASRRHVYPDVTMGRLRLRHHTHVQTLTSHCFPLSVAVPITQAARQVPTLHHLTPGRRVTRQAIPHRVACACTQQGTSTTLCGPSRARPPRHNFLFQSTTPPYYSASADQGCRLLPHPTTRRRSRRPKREKTNVAHQRHRDQPGSSQQHARTLLLVITSNVGRSRAPSRRPHHSPARG